MAVTAQDASMTGTNVDFWHVDLLTAGGPGLGKWVGAEIKPSAVCGVVIYRRGLPQLLGTCFFIAPGVAISARHIFGDYMRGESTIDSEMRLIGLSPEGSHEWHVRSVNSHEQSDVAILLPEPRRIPAKDKIDFFNLRISARPPALGETLWMYGFRQTSVDHTKCKGSFSTLAASGNVMQIFPNGRDQVFLPEYSFHVEAPTLGGMSGGPVVNQDGHVVGVISCGASFGEGFALTGVTSIAAILSRRVRPLFPSEFYGTEEYWVHELEDICIVDRENLSIMEDGRWMLRTSSLRQHGVSE